MLTYALLGRPCAWARVTHDHPRCWSCRAARTHWSESPRWSGNHGRCGMLWNIKQRKCISITTVYLFEMNTRSLYRIGKLKKKTLQCFWINSRRLDQWKYKSNDTYSWCQSFVWHMHSRSSSHVGVHCVPKANENIYNIEQWPFWVCILSVNVIFLDIIFVKMLRQDPYMQHTMVSSMG